MYFSIILPNLVRVSLNIGFQRGRHLSAIRAYRNRACSSYTYIAHHCIHRKCNITLLF